MEFYQIYPKAGSLSNVIDTGSSPTAAGVDAHLWGNGPGINQIWKASPSGSNLQFISRDTILMDLPVVNLIWDITGHSTADGTLMEMYTSNGGSNQLFALSSVYPKIQASSYNNQSGIQIETSGEGGQDICFINNGD